jgi:hypothetical protein
MTSDRRDEFKGGNQRNDGFPIIGDGKIRTLGHRTPGRGVVAVVGKMLPGFESGKATHHTVTLDSRDLPFLSADHPLPSLHRDSAIAPVTDRDEVNEGRGLIGGSRKIRCVNHPVNHGFESLKQPRKPRLHRK